MHADDSKRRAAARSLCAQLHDDDRPPPRRERRHNPTDDRKTLQLCAQVRRALEAHIPSPHPTLSDLRIERVEPAPDATRLRVTVSLDERTTHAPAEVLALLHAMTGRLRADIAAAITRKRVPSLTFTLEPRNPTP